MNTEKAAPLLLRLQTALGARNFPQCALLTKALLLQGVAVEWVVENTFRCGWGQSMAGSPGCFRASLVGQVKYLAMTKPTPVYRVGNYWSGGSSIGIDLPGRESVVGVDGVQFAKAVKALSRLAAA